MRYLVLFIILICGLFTAICNRDAASRVGIGMATGLGMLVAWSLGSMAAAGQI